MIRNKDTVKPAYSAECDGIIWKIVLDEQQDILVWECRTFDKTVSFYAYDFKQKKLLLENFPMEESWNLTISHAIDGILYLQGYESEFSPVHKGLIAFDLNKKQTLWQDFSIGVQQFAKEGIIVYDSRIIPRKYKLIDLNAGEFIEHIAMSDLNKYSSLENTLVTPKLIEADDMENTRYTLCYNDLEILSYYQAKPSGLDQLISIHKGGKEVFHEILNTDIQKLSFDTFFVWHSKLVFVRNKSEIVTYFV